MESGSGGVIGLAWGVVGEVLWSFAGEVWEGGLIDDGGSSLRGLEAAN